MRQVAFIHNIPSPYRLHMFNVIARLLARRSVGFQVHFMARRQQWRPDSWRVDDRALPFAHRFWTDLGPTIRGHHWHFNPTMLWELQRRPPDVLILGGLWDSLTCAAAALMPWPRIRAASLELNSAIAGKRAMPIWWLKRRMIRRLDFVAVPGRRGMEYLDQLLDDHHRPGVSHLPNIVDEQQFTGRDGFTTAELARARGLLGAPADRRIALWPARLVPAKGLIEFLSVLTPGLLAGWTIVIIGEGPLHDQIQATIRARGIDDRVRVIPYVAYSNMPLLYAASDLFLLPSLHDPNPLSIIEAMHSGLPVLVSDRLGNHPEAVEEGRNGWSFDPADPAQARAAAEQAFAAPPGVLAEMGARARIIADRQWNSERRMDEFLTAIGCYA